MLPAGLDDKAFVRLHWFRPLGGAPGMGELVRFQIDEPQRAFDGLKAGGANAVRTPGTASSAGPACGSGPESSARRIGFRRSWKAPSRRAVVDAGFEEPEDAFGAALLLGAVGAKDREGALLARQLAARAAERGHRDARRPRARAGVRAPNLGGRSGQPTAYGRRIVCPCSIARRIPRLRVPTTTLRSSEQRRAEGRYATRVKPTTAAASRDRSRSCRPSCARSRAPYR